MNTISSEILFRGKDKYNGEWVFGDFFREWDVFENLNSYIFENPKYGSWYKHEIIPETVGQYTGLKDCNGVKIFEGDILGLKDAKDGDVCAVVSYDPDQAMFIARSDFGSANFEDFKSDDDCADIIVIGNIHDNPGLIGGDSND